MLELSDNILKATMIKMHHLAIVKLLKQVMKESRKHQHRNRRHEEETNGDFRI